MPSCFLLRFCRSFLLYLSASTFVLLKSIFQPSSQSDNFKIRSYHSPAQTLQWISIALRVKANFLTILTMSYLSRHLISLATLVTLNFLLSFKHTKFFPTSAHLPLQFPLPILFPLTFTPLAPLLHSHFCISSSLSGFPWASPLPSISLLLICLLLVLITNSILQ